MVSSSPPNAPSRSLTRLCAGSRHYRLVDMNGDPHPVLDDLYDSLETAWQEALAWWHRENDPSQAPLGIGIEVSTGSGDWRTVRHPSL